MGKHTIKLKEMTEKELRELLIEIHEILKTKFQTEDTPKGETVPGVNFIWLAAA